MKLREYTFDVLRVVAASAIVLLHVIALFWYDMPVTDYKWIILNNIKMLARLFLPIFFMISGRFFLDLEKDMTYRKLFLKYILRLVTAFIFWSAVYTFLNIIDLVWRKESILSAAKWLVVDFFQGEYHMWFIYVMVGLYIIVPLLRKITADKKTMEYFLVLFFVFQIFLYNCVHLPKVGIIVSNALNTSVFSLAMGYSGYFVLGYYLWRFELSNKFKTLVYILGILGIVFTCIGSTVYSLMLQAPNEDIADYFMPNIVLGDIAVYLFFIKNKYFANKDRGKTAFIEKLSGYCFGVYLIHPAVIWILIKLDILGIFNELIMVPVITMFTIVMSYLLVSIIKRFRVGKYIS